VLDLACGDGHNGIYLAREGLHVICCDRSIESLERAAATAAGIGVPIETWQVNLERDGVNPLPENRYRGVVVFRYLHRPLIPAIKKSLIQAGVLVYETYTVEQPRFGRPRNQNFLLQPGELHGWFNDWDVLHYFEGERDDPPRAVAQLVCRKPRLPI